MFYLKLLGKVGKGIYEKINGPLFSFCYSVVYMAVYNRPGNDLAILFLGMYSKGKRNLCAKTTVKIFFLGLFTIVAGISVPQQLKIVGVCDISVQSNVIQPLVLLQVDVKYKKKYTCISVY